MADSYSTRTRKGATVSWHIALGYLTGFRWIDPQLDPATLLRTVLMVHVCDALLCRLFAYNNHHPKNLWTGLGFVFGLWAIAVLLVLPKRTAGLDARPAPDRATPRDRRGAPVDAA
jgi:hypothetical protein